jgi:hypothetical protein
MFTLQEVLLAMPYQWRAASCCRGGKVHCRATQMAATRLMNFDLQALFGPPGGAPGVNV